MKRKPPTPLEIARKILDLIAEDDRYQPRIDLVMRVCQRVIELDGDPLPAPPREGA